MKLDLKTVTLVLSVALNLLGGSGVVPPVVSPAANFPSPCVEVAK